MPHARRRVAIAWCLFFLLAACGSDDNNAAAPSGPMAKIMPLGDSITESAAGQSTYRYFLWQLARANGYRIDFVGTKSGAFGGPPANTDFDMDHEGHWGWRTDQVLARLADGAAATASPDIVLMHLGHNDLCQDEDIPGTIEELGATIDLLRTVNPNVAVLLARNIPSTFQCHAEMPAFIAQLPALVSAKTTAESPVVLVDQHTGFDPLTMTWDGVHPNAAGESQMADRWWAALRPLLDRFVAVTG
jgi:acyl-CoA thioesterase I